MRILVTPAFGIDSFAPSELHAFVNGTQGSAKPPPWAESCHAFGVGALGVPRVRAALDATGALSYLVGVVSRSPRSQCIPPTPFARTSSPVRDSRFGSWSGAHGGNNKADHRPADRG
jgi:hypothetical protein